jgi:hypothetical protein
MSLACPNKSSKEWKMLVSQTGEDLANLAFVANGYRIPDVKTATEIKRAIAFKPIVENYAGIAHRLRKYNEQNGTSHYFTMEKAWGNTFKLELKYNYLPVNIEKQRQRMAAKGDPLYAVNEFDADGFAAMYPINVAAVKPKPTPPSAKPGDQLSLFSAGSSAETLMPRPPIDYKKSDFSRVYFNNSDKVTAKDILSNIASGNRVMAPIARHLFNYADINNVDVFLEKGIASFIVPQTNINSIGVYNPNDNTIRLAENMPVNVREETMVHEILHAVSYKALRENGKFPQAFQKLYEKSKESLGGYNAQTGEGEYANYSIDEFFVALFTNGAFITKLQNTPPIDSKEFDNLLEEIFAYILGVLDLKPGTTLYSQAFAVATNILEETSQDIQLMRASEEAFRAYMESQEYQEYLEGENEATRDVLGSAETTGFTSRTDESLNVRPGVQEIFNATPELAQIGTPQQYSQYLNSIFPASQIKDIVYHSTNANIEKFREGITYFTQSKTHLSNYGRNKIAAILNVKTPGYSNTLISYGSIKVNKNNDAIILTEKQYNSILNQEDPSVRTTDNPNITYKQKEDGSFVEINDLSLTFTPITKEKYLTGKIPTKVDLGSDNFIQEIAVFNPEQIHVLGNQEDINGFRKFVNSTENRSDEILESAYTQVEAVEKKRENKINTEITRQRQLLKNVKDSDELTKIMGKIEKLKKESDIAESRVILSKSINSFEDVLQFADKELNEIKKLLNNDAVSADDAYYAQRVLDLWIKAGDFSTSPQEHIILDEDEFNTSEDVTLPDGTVIPSIRSKFRAMASKAQDLQNRLTQIKKEHVTKFVQKYTDGRVTTEDIYKHIKDVHKIGTLTLNLSRHDDPMAQAAFLAVEEANMLAQQEAAEVWQKLDKLTPIFLKKAGGNFNILKQLTSDGKETGRVVHRFSSEFFDTRNTLMSNAFWAKDKSGKLKKDPADVKAYFDWVNANTITFDVRALFPDSQLEDSTIPNDMLFNEVTFTEAEKAKHIADLKAQLGEKGYRTYLAQAETKIEKFKVLRQAIYESMQMEPGLSEAEKNVLFKDWLKENSPYWGVHMNENPSSRQKEGGGFYAPKGVREHAIQVPRKTVNGKLTNWYDKNFAKIEADSDLLEYHEFLMKTLNQMRYLLPQQKQPLMNVGVLPTIQKSIMDMFSEKGMMIGVVPFWDKMKELQTTTDFATNVYSDVNPLTNEIEKTIQVKYISDTDSEVREIVKQKKIQHKQQTGQPATLAEIKKFREDAKDYLSKQKSWDVTKIMKAYTMEVLAHKHKSLIEPQIKLLDQAFKDKKEIITNKAGQAQKKDGEVLDKEGLANLKSAWDFFFDSTYYNIGSRKVEGVSKTKLYSADEKKQKAELEELIAKETDEENKKFLQQRLDNLGGYRTASGTGDAVLKYMTLKGLGYNLFSGVSNIGFGLISNLIEASGGQNYSMTNFRKASMLVTNSIGRNASFNLLFSNPNGNAVKIRTLMDKWDLNSTSTKEMFDTSNKSSMSKLKRFGPFSIQERSEYLNIAPVMVAIMMEFPAKDPSGKTVTMWDAYEPSTGKLKDGYTTEVDEIKMFQKIKRVVEMNHGDYYNQLQVKETIGGRALSQFRTWMFEGFANRFEAEKPDYALSYGSDEPYIRKGRYRSYTKGQLLTTGAAVGTAFLPGIGTAVGAGIGYIGGKFFGMATNENLISDTLFTLKQLARKLMFQKTQFGDKFSKTDAANMRKNMTELYIMLTLMGTAMVFKALAGGDDDDDDDAAVLNFLLNQTIRLRTDIGFYTNPLEFEKLTKTAVPMAQLVSDVHALFTDIGNYYGEDSKDKSIFESGPFKGSPKWFIHAGQFLPGTSQLIRLYRTGDKVMN